MKDKGFVLLGMLFLMLLLAVTAVALNRRAAVQARMATNQTQATQAYLSRVAVFQHAVWKLTNDPCWRTIQMEAYTDLTFATGAGNDTITTAAGDFDADGFEQGGQIAIVYSSPDTPDNNNDGIYTILNDVSANPGTIEVANGTLPNPGGDGAGAATIAGLSATMNTYNDLTFATGAGEANDTITTAAGDFHADGFSQGDQIAIVYSSPDNNDGIYTILNDVSADPDTIEVDNNLLNAGGAGSGTATIAAIVLTDEEVTFNHIDYSYLALNSIVPKYRDAITVVRTKPGVGTPVKTSFRYYIDTVAGTGVGDYNGDGIQATTAEIKKPKGVFVDALGNIYIADTENHRIRKVDTSGIITTVAGNGNSSPFQDGVLATSTTVNKPHGVFVDALGNIYIADTDNNRIRKVDTSGFITTVAGNGNSSPFQDGVLATSTTVNKPHGVFVDSSGNIFIADTENHCIRKVDKDSKFIDTVAGIGTSSDFEGDGGPATSAKLNKPQGVFVDTSGNIYIADTENHCIRKVVEAASQFIYTIAGIGEDNDFSGDGGPATSAKLDNPQGVFVDASGNIFIADTENHTIRVVSTHDQKINTLAGTGTAGFNGDNQPAVKAKLNKPSGIAMAATRGGAKIYISDTHNNRIRVLTFKPVKKL